MFIKVQIVYQVFLFISRICQSKPRPCLQWPRSSAIGQHA